MMVVIVGTLRGTSVAVAKSGVNVGYVKQLGKVLFEEFLLPFEISSILLLAAMVGVVMVGKLDHKVDGRQPIVNGSATIDNGLSNADKEKLTINQ
jgi:hypothetical protein